MFSLQVFFINQQFCCGQGRAVSFQLFPRKGSTLGDTFRVGSNHDHRLHALKRETTEEICFSFSRQRFETLECETDLQLSPGDIVKVKFEIFDDLGYLVGGVCLTVSV